MYATLSLNRLLSLLVIPFGVLLLAYVFFRGMPIDLASAGRMLSSVATIWGVILFAAFGFSGKWSPWRIIWFLCPPLNRWLPDLNGIWRGTTHSNWSVIETVMKGATGAGPKVKREELPKIDLKVDEIVLTIRASLFIFEVDAILKTTGGTSESITERLQKRSRRDAFELFYVYEQNTPDPEHTDEGRHVGAARLDVDLDKWVLKGEYWNRRCWRSGENAAGRMEVERISR